ncbi:hypothetical protein INR49_000126 [Caranx melampygus]|nr:hypothetical protein INR49_000126 [Caranx melampygus]
MDHMSGPPPAEGPGDAQAVHPAPQPRVRTVWSAPGRQQLSEAQSVMGLHRFWQNYKVLIVMGTSLGLIHWGWYNLKSSPVLHPPRQDFIPEPGIVTHTVVMKPQSWLRRNWLWVGGGAFLSIHLFTWLLQRTMKSAVRSEAALRQRDQDRGLD